VSSFANASGGDLIFGIKESAGLPPDVCGCTIPDSDAEIKRFDRIVQTRLNPRVPCLSMRTTPFSKRKVLIIIRVPKSWASPHMITFKDWSRFYSRNSAGKYLLDVGELRAAFALSETIGERLKQFRNDRLGKIIADEGPISLVPSARIVLHL